MDWHTIAAGAIGFLAGWALTVFWAALAVGSDSSRAEEEDERRAARAENRRREEEEERKGRS